MDARDDEYDVVGVGGGAAGLGAALSLVRSRRSVLVVDAGDPRNVVGAAAAGGRVAAAVNADLVAEDARRAVAVARRHAGAAHGDGMGDRSSWEERYSSADPVWSGRPNDALVAEVTGLEPGTALDAGCGEGADTVWLAAGGWQVTAVDFAEAGLRRGASQASEIGADVAGRIDWVQADLTSWTPQDQRYDLVSTHFLHLPPEPRKAAFARLAAAVAPGGCLLVVGHHPDDLDGTMRRHGHRDSLFTALEVLADLDPGQWDVVTADARARTAVDPSGQEVAIADAVLRVRRRG